MQTRIEEIVEGTTHGNVLHVEGEIDLATAPSFHRILTELAGRDLPFVVDLSSVEYMDLSGLHVLEEVHRLLKERGLGFAMVASCYSVHRLLELVELEGPLVFPSVEVALQFVQSQVDTQ